MEFSEEAIREERERLSFNHPGFNYPLMHRWIKKDDTLEMARVIRRSAHHLKGFINWAQYAPRWDFKQIQRFVNDHVNPEPPRMHLVFLLGKLCSAPFISMIFLSLLTSSTDTPSLINALII